MEKSCPAERGPEANLNDGAAEGRLFLLPPGLQGIDRVVQNDGQLPECLVRLWTVAVGQPDDCGEKS